MSSQNSNRDKNALVHQLIEVQAHITVTPLVSHGKPKVYCIDSNLKPDKDCNEGRGYEKPGDKCTYTLTQVICIEIPIEMGVDVDIEKGIVHCGKPNFGPCKPPCKKKDPIVKDDNELIPGGIIEKHQE